MSPEPTPADGPDFEAARQQVSTPGMVLLIGGILNVLLALYAGASGVQVASLTPEQFEEKVIAPAIQQNPKAADLLSKPEIVEKLRWGFGPGLIGWAAVALVLGLVVCFAGVRMRQLRSWGLAVTGGFLAAIPCLSYTACCGFGEVAGIWALIVLFRDEVRSAFR
jgi:hypothetical protein